MNIKCTNCKLVNYSDAMTCGRCGIELSEKEIVETVSPFKGPRIATRAVVCLLVIVALFLGFYISLVASASSLNIEQKATVRASIRVLKEKGFSTEAMLLKNLTVFRSNDNWLNSSVAKENAYAATNFPFEIMTLYSDFFTYPVDETERAAILLHEARHLAGKNEHDAYEFVWKNRKQLGWTVDKYNASVVWQNVRKQTKEIVPELFTCEGKPLGDCTE